MGGESGVDMIGIVVGVGKIFQMTIFTLIGFAFENTVCVTLHAFQALVYTPQRIDRMGIAGGSEAYLVVTLFTVFESRPLMQRCGNARGFILMAKCAIGGNVLEASDTVTIPAERKPMGAPEPETGIAMIETWVRPVVLGVTTTAVVAQCIVVYIVFLVA